MAGETQFDKGFTACDMLITMLKYSDMHVKI